MKVYNDLSTLPAFQGSVITIGSFDGVHTGHQKILERVHQLAKSIDAPSIVITFEPHPRLVLNSNDTSLKLLTTTDEKIALLENSGIDNVVIVPFTKAFAEQSPLDYIENFLVKYFKPIYIVIGYDHRFGTKRSGTLNLLRQYEKKFGYEVIEIEKQIVDSLDVSSTKIRYALEHSDVESATRLLGHSFIFTGKVVKGQQIGREIGFPTANLDIADKHKLIPPHGIYAVFVWVEGVRYKGMMYHGDRPVLKDFNNVTLEINIFDFNQDIYDKILRVELIAFLRSDRRFGTLESLIVQLAEDERESRQILIQHENKRKPHVAVVILNYNTPQYLQQFLPSVCESAYGNSDIFVADNGSTDNSIDVIREINLEGIPAANGLDRIRVIDLKTNYGFAKGYNEALKHEKLKPFSSENPDGYKYYALLNSDCRVSEGWLNAMVTLMESDKTIAATQPKVLSYAKKRRFEHAGGSGGWIDSLGYTFSRGRIFLVVEKDKKQYDDAAEIFWASGAAMLVRADVWHQFGGFDPLFWAHFEEIDLCWRMKRAGYKIMAQPLGVVRHVGGGTMEYGNPKKTFLNFRNNLFAVYKNESAGKLLWLLPVRFCLDTLAALKFLKDKQSQHAKAVFKAYSDFIKKIPALNRQKKSDKQIIETYRIGVPNKNGIYHGSIIWEHFVLKKKYFYTLFGKKLHSDIESDIEEE